MEKALVALTEALPSVLGNSQFNITMAGWPAAVTAIAICCAGVLINAIKASHADEVIIES